MSERKGSATFQMSQFPGDMLRDFTAIREFAYEAFDNLDLDGNGYIDRQELMDALAHPGTSAQEREFITFLLNNQEQIAESFEERRHERRDGISRVDLECYFRLIMSML